MLASNMSDSVIDDDVAVRNASNSGPSACGGNCLVNSHNNRIRRNQFSGNGSVGPPSNDFGVGLIGTSSGNVIEHNSIGGNINGVLIQPNAAGNLIRRNVIVGNPPGQISRVSGPLVGFDIRDDSTVPGSGVRNRIERNWCLTYGGPGPAPCPNLPGPGEDGGDDQRGLRREGGAGTEDAAGVRLPGRTSPGGRSWAAQAGGAPILSSYRAREGRAHARRRPAPPEGRRSMPAR